VRAGTALRANGDASGGRTPGTARPRPVGYTPGPNGAAGEGHQGGRRGGRAQGAMGEGPQGAAVEGHAQGPRRRVRWGAARREAAREGAGEGAQGAIGEGPRAGEREGEGGREERGGEAYLGIRRSAATIHRITPRAREVEERWQGGRGTLLRGKRK
jgi:hypothetical protein